MKLKISHLSNMLLAIAAIIGGYALTDIYLLKKSLPLGVCPVIRNRPLLYTAISLAVLAFILSFIKDKAGNDKPE